MAKVDPQLAKILTQMTRYHFEDRYQSAQSALQALTAFSQAGINKPQPITTINQSVLNDLDTTHAAIAASARAENELVAPSLLPDANLQNSIEQSQSHSVSINRQTAPTEIDSSSAIKPQFAKIIFAIAIALGTVIIGGIYLLMQQSILNPQLDTPAPSEIPNSSTPRMKQGEGFRKNL